MYCVVDADPVTTSNDFPVAVVTSTPGSGTFEPPNGVVFVGLTPLSMAVALPFVEKLSREFVAPVFPDSMETM